MPGILRAVAFAVVVTVAGGAWAAPAPPVKVELTADGVPAWQADAVATTLARTLEGGKLPGPARAVAIRGALAPDRLTWSIVVAGATVKHGVLELRGTDIKQVAGALRSEIGRVLQPGERQVLELPASVGAPETTGVLGLILVAVFLLVPFVVMRPPGLWRMRSLRRTAAVIVALGIVAVGLIAGRGYEWSWAVFAGGGLAWGSFVAVTLPVMFPALPGLDRVEHAELLEVLARWAILALQRTVELAVFYTPFMVALAGVCAVLDVPARIELAVLVPAWGLCVRLWVQAWVEIVAARLDRELVDGDPTEANPWHLAVRGYFLGYVRRVGWSTDDRVVESIRFLPGTTDAVIAYGGGATHPRIVVPRPLLELALAPYGRPHDYAAPRVSTLHWTLWNAGLVVPTELGAVMATAEQRQPRAIAAEGDVEAVVIGEPATLAGIVEPDTLDPRPSYRPHEDPLWLDYDAGEEFDGTDAGDKDFLFGLLVHELGAIRRHEDRSATLGVGVRRWLTRHPGPGRIVVPIQRALGRTVERVADAHAGLNFARHHFVQYLGWRVWRREDLLTARAHAPELERQSRAIARMIEGEADAAADPTAAGAWGRDAGGAPDVRARIARITRAAARPRARRWRRLALAAVALAAAGGVAVAVIRAVDYHATYEARIRTRMEKIDGEGK